MSNIPAPLFWLWVAITVPVVVVGGVVTYEVHNLPIATKVVYQKVVVTPTVAPSATPSATPKLQTTVPVKKTIIVPVVTGGVK